MKRRKSRKWEVARTMPNLKHSIPGQPYDVTQSEVVQWLIRQPEIMQLVFDAVKDRRDIVYDKENGMWRGAEYAD